MGWPQFLENWLQIFGNFVIRLQILWFDLNFEKIDRKFKKFYEHWSEISEIVW